MKASRASLSTGWQTGKPELDDFVVVGPAALTLLRRKRPETALLFYQTLRRRFESPVSAAQQSTVTITGMEELDAFAIYGSAELTLLRRKYPDLAKRYSIHLLGLLQQVCDGRTVAAERVAPPAAEDRRPGGQPAQAVAPAVADADGFKALLKPRQGMVIEAVILQTVAQSVRAVSIDGIFTALTRPQFVEASARGALVTRLNRLKTTGLLTWTSGMGVQDIRITTAGHARIEELLNRFLNPHEIGLLQRRAPGIVPSAAAPPQ